MSTEDLFAIPILDQFLLYAPLSKYARVLSKGELENLRQALESKGNHTNPFSAQILSYLQTHNFTADPIPQGRLSRPFFLGLITTRGCNMGCRYCDFSSVPKSSPSMAVELARSVIEAYLDLLSQTNQTFGEVQFFGGEPFFKNHIVEFTVGYARYAAQKRGIELRFEVTTNGMFSPKRCAWVADNLDAVVLSLDGMAQIQNLHRPQVSGAGSFEIVFQNAKILSEGNCDLIIRACVTEQSVSQLTNIASWFAENLIPSAVCFEPLTACELSNRHGLLPPSPLTFAVEYLKAEELLAQFGIPTMTSGTDIDRLQSSFCPVGKDAILVSPEGKLNACYLLEAAWEREGLDLCFGGILPGSSSFQINMEKLSAIRSLAAHPHPLCADCFCKYHCAGGCHVNHRAVRETNIQDRVCIQTRLITIGKLLKRLRKYELYQHWLKELEQGSATGFNMPNILL